MQSQVWDTNRKKCDQSETFSHVPLPTGNSAVVPTVPQVPTGRGVSGDGSSRPALLCLLFVKHYRGFCCHIILAFSL